MALNIKNPEVERLAARVARLADETKTEAIRRALEEREIRLRAKAGKRVHLESTMEWLEKNIWSKIPPEKRGLPPLTREEEDEILGFGPGGV